MPINIKKKIELSRVVLDLSLKPFTTWIITIFPFWYGTFIGLYSISFFSVIYGNFYYCLIFILIPIIALLGIIIRFYKDFNKITLFKTNYQFTPNLDDYDYMTFPCFIVSENFETRFSFKLNLYGNAPSQFQGKRFALIVIKAPTINISIKRRKELNQDFDDVGNIFYLTQDYELNSSQLSFVLFVQANGAVDAKDLEIYIMCEDNLENFLEDYKKDKKTRPNIFISKEEFYLSHANY